MSTDFNLPDDLVGRWWFEHESEDSPGLLIFDEGGRAVQFHTVNRRLAKREVMRLWFTVADSTTIQFRLKSIGEGWPRTVRRTDSGFSIASDDKVFPMWTANNAELPVWLEEDYLAAVDRMKAEEAAKPNNKTKGEQVGDGDADEAV